MPAEPGEPGGTAPFQTKCDLAVALLRAEARIIAGKHLGVFDGGYACGAWSGGWSGPRTGCPGSSSSPGCAPTPGCLPCPRRSPPRGSRPQAEVGQKTAPAPSRRPLAGPWHVGFAFVYGRMRRIRWKEVVCLWRVLGHEVPVKAIAAEVEGYKKRFTLVTSAVELTGSQMVELFAARFRQEDGFRDLKQRLGLGGVPGLDQEPDRADHPGAMGDDEPAATVAVPPGGDRGPGLVGPAALEPGQGSAERAGRRAASAADRGEIQVFSRNGWELERIRGGCGMNRV